MGEALRAPDLEIEAEPRVQGAYAKKQIVLKPDF